MQDVIIVGAGPAGLFAACELARHGVQARVVERSTEHHGQARGTALQPGTLEMLQRAGVLETLLAQGMHVRGVRILGPGMVERGRSLLAGIDAAFELECCQPQSQTEDILYAHLQSLGGDVELGVSVNAVLDKGDSIELSLVHRDGREETAQARYIIGASGSHSVVRQSMAQPRLEGQTYEGHYIVGDVALGITPEAGFTSLLVGPKGLVLLAPLPNQRFLIFVDCLESDLEAGPPTAELIAALIDARAEVEVGVKDVRWASPFRMHKRIAPSLSDGKRFLVGDSGHASSPLGGQGLNTALMDAADLAWKMALVVRGRGRRILLDSYAFERERIDSQILDISDGIHTQVMSMIADSRAGKSEPAPQPDEALEAADLVKRRAKALLSVSCVGSPLVAEHLKQSTDAATGPAPGERYPDRSHLSGPLHHLLLFGPLPAGLDHFRSRWGDLVEVVDTAETNLQAARAGVADGGFILVRPDGHIGFRATSMDEAAMAALEAHLDSYLIPLGG